MTQSNNKLQLEEVSDLGYGHLLSILWRRRVCFAGVFCGVLAISMLVALTKKPLYKSQMQLLVESSYQSKESSRYSNKNEQEFADSGIEIDYATQINLMRSYELLRKVVDKLGIKGSDAEIKEIIEQLRESITVARVLENQKKDGIETKILQAEYFSDDPINAKTVLEAIQEVYLEYNSEQQEKRLRDGLNFINQQIPQARTNLVEVEQGLTELRQNNDLIAPERDAIALENALDEIQKETAKLQAEKERTRGIYRQLQQQLGLSEQDSKAIARLNQSSRYQYLLTQFQETELELSNQRSRFTKDSPVVQDLIEKRNSQKALLLKEVKQILGELPPNFEFLKIESRLKLVNGDTDFVETITQSEADLTGIEEQNLSLAATEAEIQEKLTKFPELIARFNNLTQEVKIKRDALQRLLAARQELEIEISRGASNWQTIEPPQLGIQVAPNTLQDMLLGLVVASFMGATSVFIRDTLDDRVYNSKLIEARIPLPLLGSTPGLPAGKPNRFVVRLPFRSPQANSLEEIICWQPFRESLDLIYENLQMVCSHSALKSLAVTSAIAGEGKSTLTLGLASSIARHGKKVLVVDGDLRCPSLHQKLGLENRIGLTDLLMESVPYPHINQVTFGGETIHLLTSGTTIADPVKLLSSANFKQTLERFQNSYDLVLIDTPPTLGMVDAIKIASCSSGTIIVTRLNQVKASELTEAANLLSKLNVLGIVANDSPEVIKQYQKQPQYLLSQQV